MCLTATWPLFPPQEKGHWKLEDNVGNVRNRERQAQPLRMRAAVLGFISRFELQKDSLEMLAPLLDNHH
jgi:hypothetical protein